MVSECVFTVPPGLPFLDALARAILAGDLPRPGGAPPTPISLSGYTLLLPTRRATRALQEAFLRASGGAALLLPKIRPIAEGEEDLSLLAGSAGLDGLGPMSADIPPAISEIERRLVLTELVLKWSSSMRAAPGGDGDLAPFAAAGAATPAQAANLAAELAGLMDMVETEGVDLVHLKSLVPEEFSEHWIKTLDFLGIVVEMWPAILAGKGMLTPAARRNRVLMAEARRLAAVPPQGPVIVAGVTGSIPAATTVMQAVAALPAGAIVLPALDQELDDATFAIAGEAHPEHPQFGLARLLAALGVARADVRELPGPARSPAAMARAALVSEAMRPATTTDRWHTYAAAADKARLAEGLTGVALLEAPSAEDEAEVVALVLREALEKPGRTAALVTRDRLLARRVVVRLDSLGIAVDDSAGRPFAKTVPGAFLNLVAETVAQDFAPATLMALLKHPLARLGLGAAAVRRAGRALEIAAFRTPYLGRGLVGVDAALERASREVQSGERRGGAVHRLWEADWTAARDLVRRLAAALQPLTLLAERRDAVSLKELAKAHAEVTAELARLPQVEPTGAGEDAAEVRNPLWEGEAGEAAQTFFTALLDPAVRSPSLVPADYPDFYRSLIAGESVRPRGPTHPRIAIWGPFESRLQQPDIVVLGSLNEGTWPAPADPGPWLNRPMRKALGLPSPEAAVGYAAHDFTSLLGAGEVVMTRALKIDGVPTVASRWLMRLTALLDGLGLRHTLAAEQPWLAWARARDLAPKRPPLAAPAPCPPLALRPRQLSVTQIEAWIANPYAIFAAHILQLEALEPLGQQPDAALKGAIVHAALGRFAQRHPASLPADIAGALLAEAEFVLREVTGHPRVAAFWLPRLERFAAWFSETEPARRTGVSAVAAEVTGRRILAAPGGPFTLKARADRIDMGDRRLVVTDYKTGWAPGDGQVIDGTAPQLPLEAAIAMVGGFAGVPEAAPTQLCYIRVTGADPPGETRIVKIADVGALADATIAGLERLVARYDDPATPYRAMRRAAFADKYRYDGYAHLARVDEWSADSGEEG